MIGLESSNLMRVVAKAAELTLSKLPGVKKADAQIVHQWLAQHVNWGALVLRCPNTETVERHLKNWASIQKNPKVLELIEAAVQRWGRNNLFDWPTKIGIVINKSDDTSLGYIVESLFAHMWRKNQGDPYGAVELQKVAAELLWTRHYILACCRQFPAMMTSTVESAVDAQRMLHAPHRVLHEDGEPRPRPYLGAIGPK